MIQNAVAAFVGAFIALLVFAELQGSNKLLIYFARFIVGLIGAVLLCAAVFWVVTQFSKIG